MRFRLRIILFCGLFLFSSSCSQNIYSGLINTNNYGDQGYYTDAIIKMNAYNWDAAITDFSKMSTSFLAQRSTMFLHAQILAGKCGFDFIGLFNSFSSNSASIGVAGGTPLFLWLMQAQQTTTVNMAETGVTASAASALTDTYCSQAQSIMDSIQTNFGSWSSDEQLFVAVYSLAKIGLILKYWADPTGTGSPANTFDICKQSNIPDFYIKQIITGFSLAIQNISALSSSPAIITSLSTACTTLGLSICSETSPSTPTATDILNMRSLLSLEDSNLLLSYVGINSSTSAATVATTTPENGSIWQCSGLGAMGVASCCPSTYP